MADIVVFCKYARDGYKLPFKCCLGDNSACVFQRYCFNDNCYQQTDGAITCLRAKEFEESKSTE